MKPIHKKKLKWSLGILISISFAIGIVFFNNYLKKENLFIYKTGTNKKAILNATWNMSYKEIERVNKVKLKNAPSFVFFEDELNKLLDPNRIVSKTNKSMNLWSFDSELIYEFFDNRLFKYSLLGKVYEPFKFDSIATKNLKERYGMIKRNSDKYGGTFSKDSVFVQYRQFDIEREDNNVEHRFLIEVTYQPLFNEIVRTANKEQNSIFK